MSEVTVARAGSDHLPDWADMRQQLWPDDGRAAHEASIRDLLCRNDHAGFVARDGDNRAIGFAEAAVRIDWVNGCDTSPVLFLEGLFVLPAGRRRGVARTLVRTVSDWGRARGLSEFASDAPLENTKSHAMHRALGFAATERVQFFRRELAIEP